MIKINKLYAYLIGLVLTLVIYFIGQLFFFINTEKVQGQICDITTSRGGSSRYPGRVEVYYVCFVTKDDFDIKLRAGSNLQYGFGDTVTVFYKKSNPRKARLGGFTELWLVPSIVYLVPFALIMGIITAIYYGNRYALITKNPFKISMIARQDNDSY